MTGAGISRRAYDCIDMLQGFHHLTAITSRASENVRFYTQTLGLRLVKKTVNQDDTSSYHLFYADARGTPGTDITFFDWPAYKARQGTRSVVRTGFRVGSATSLEYWEARLRERGVKVGSVHEQCGRAILDFEDTEGQRLGLAVDETPHSSQPWELSEIPPEHQLRGLGPIWISVPAVKPTHDFLTSALRMELAGHYRQPASDGSPTTASVHVYRMTPGGADTELHVMIEPSLLTARPGAGAVHHVAFRVPDEATLLQAHRLLTAGGTWVSGPIDRFYFKSLYFNEPGGVLCEIATDGPGFTADEPIESLGERLSLPPFLEPNRARIEAGLKPL